MKKNYLTGAIGFALLGMGTVSTGVSAHGFVSAHGELPGRAALCSSRDASGPLLNQSCGQVQWEPQSVEGPEGFPEAGPADGQIAAAGGSSWAPLNEQTGSRWHKNQISSGANVFTWQKTAPHVTKNWKYYITKADWNPNAPLTRAQLDLTPFCEFDGGMTQPDMVTYHNCVVPEREGYHLILAVWDVGDTDQAFYNVIDVEFDGDNNPEPSPDPIWSDVGTIAPGATLKAGDTVYTRVFDSNGEVPSQSTSLTIDESITDFNKWSYALASKINSEHSLIQAGPMNEEGVAEPAFGQNPIFASIESSVTSVEIGYDIVAEPEYGLIVEGLESSYVISDEPTVIDLALTAEGDVQVEIRVLNENNERVAFESVEIQDGYTENVSLELSKSEVGKHQIQGILKDSSGEFVKQHSAQFSLVDEGSEIPGDYDFVFPEGLSGYTAGTRVLATDGNVYECQGWPNSGFCSQWNENATHYEPGTGSHWEQAWIRSN